MTQLTVVIIGGGIGGLFAANALIARGFDVSIYEQAPALGEVGAGVFLTPNSVRQLQRVGLGHQVERWGARVGHGSHYFRHDGAPIAPVQVTDSAGWNATFGMHRADLVEMLSSALPSGVVRTGHRGTGFEQAGEVESASIITDRDSGRSKGFGFVEFSNADQAKQALSLNGTEFGGRSLTVNEARPKNDDRSGGGGGGGRSRY